MRAWTQVMRRGHGRRGGGMGDEAGARMMRRGHG